MRGEVRRYLNKEIRDVIFRLRMVVTWVTPSRRKDLVKRSSWGRKWLSV